MHEKFHYKTLDEIKQTAAALGVALPLAADTHALAESLRVGKHVFPNRLGIAPMEGADSLPDGSPSDFTARRYLREAKGGSAIIWFEAISIVPEGRSSGTLCQGCLRNSLAVIQNQTLDFVAHGFFARFTEMNFDAVGGLSDFLYHYRWRGFLYGQRGSGCGGAAVAGVVVHRLSFP